MGACYRAFRYIANIYHSAMRVLLINAHPSVKYLFGSWIWLYFLDFFILTSFIYYLDISFWIFDIWEAASILQLVFLIVVSLKSPSYTVRDQYDEAALALLGDPSLEMKKKVSGAVCQLCNSTRPLRSYHCSICGRCVIRHDHHSLTINQCIGYGNQIFYFLFLLASIVSYLTWWYAVVRWITIAFITNHVWLCLFGTSISLFHTFLSIAEAKPLLRNVFDNLTQFEATYFYRLPYLRNEELSFQNPFQSSPFRSFLEFFHISGLDYISADVVSSRDDTLPNKVSSQKRSWGSMFLESASRFIGIKPEELQAPDSILDEPPLGPAISSLTPLAHATL